MLNLLLNQASNENIYKEFADEVISFFEDESNGVANTFRNIVYHIFKFKQANPSQETLGEHSYITRVQTNRCVKILRKRGYISYIKRHLSSNIYTLHEKFNHPGVQERLKHIIPQLMFAVKMTLAFATTPAFGENVTQINIKLSPSVINIYLPGGKQPVVGSQASKRTVRARTRGPLAYQIQNGWNDFLKKTVRREKFMEIYNAPAIDKIKSLNLTQKGKDWLRAFPEHIIELVDEIMIKRGTKRDSFNYFVVVALIKCKEQNIVPDWSLAKSLIAYHGFKDTDPYVLSNQVNKPIVNKQAVLPKKTSNTLKQEGGMKRQEVNPYPNIRYKPLEMVISDDKKGFVAMNKLLFQTLMGLKPKE